MTIVPHTGWDCFLAYLLELSIRTFTPLTSPRPKLNVLSGLVEYKAHICYKESNIETRVVHSIIKKYLNRETHLPTQIVSSESEQTFIVN